MTLEEELNQIDWWIIISETSGFYDNIWEAQEVGLTIIKSNITMALLSPDKDIRYIAKGLSKGVVGPYLYEQHWAPWPKKYS